RAGEREDAGRRGPALERAGAHHAGRVNRGAARAGRATAAPPRLCHPWRPHVVERGAGIHGPAGCGGEAGHVLTRGAPRPGAPTRAPASTVIAAPEAVPGRDRAMRPCALPRSPKERDRPGPGGAAAATAREPAPVRRDGRGTRPRTALAGTPGSAPSPPSGRP